MNREAASKLCRERSRRKFDCDEYPYAATQQGCYSPYVAARARCRIDDVPVRQNRGAGSLYGWFIRKQRLMIGEDFFIQPVWATGPT
ncbi:NucA/NucB deoxyribonuclease domain-containing protein [Nocardioides jishulii]|uniref:Deoxyribonuclease NucA/NucB domain-containing protein n=1 Tax=Nocardioides jishulii TaxID=2575440 RepID=A0A4U2YTB1_9ACTN|nr:hypothetical protein FCL41_16015 [Nocardioides jishulii]TKI64244.1 hypothetical protein FC770_03550 [Nocardioides jishulii]